AHLELTGTEGDWSYFAFSAFFAVQVELLLSSRALLQPNDVAVSRLSHSTRKWGPPFFNARHRAGVHPTPDLRATVGKGQAARPIVVITRQVLIPLSEVGPIWPAGHVGEEISPVDRVFALVPEQGRPGRTGVNQVREPAVKPPGRTLYSSCSRGDEVEH